jgi:putative acyl-CoA dehydrogenase
MNKYSDFFQEGPELANTFKSDKVLNTYLNQKIPTVYRAEIFKHLEEVGQKASSQWAKWALQAETNKPRLVQFDEWGRRVDEIIIDQGWKNLEAAAATEGVVAAAYERKHAELSRVYQMALLYLYHPSSAFSHALWP